MWPAGGTEGTRDFPLVLRGEEPRQLPARQTGSHSYGRLTLSGSDVPTGARSFVEVPYSHLDLPVPGVWLQAAPVAGLSFKIVASDAFNPSMCGNLSCPPWGLYLRVVSGLVARRARWLSLLLI